MGAKFRRQHPLGSFIVDFYCMQVGLVIELDGGQHALRHEEDRRRTAWFTQEGHRVLRFWNHEVLHDIDAVLERIRDVLKTPHPGPLPEGIRAKFRG
jgi:very-short-patch-repair endonuclease